MGVINMPQSLANQLHLWIWHRGNQRFMIWCPCLFHQYHFLSNTQFLICCCPLLFTPLISLESFLSKLQFLFFLLFILLCLYFFVTFLLLCLFCRFFQCIQTDITGYICICDVIAYLGCERFC